MTELLSGKYTYTEHPLGFTRAEYKLPDVILRTHVWLEAGHMDTDKHQHGASFRSRLLAGAMVERLFEPKDDPEGSHELWPVVTHTDPDGSYHIEVQRDQVSRVEPVLIDEVTYRVGEEYERQWNQYHQVEVIEAPLVTVTEWGAEAATRKHFFMRSIEHPESLHAQARHHEKTYF